MPEPVPEPVVADQPPGGPSDAPVAALVAVDLQVVFADPASAWATPGFADVVPVVRALVEAFDAAGAPVVFTRFLAPERPAGVWAEYYEQWPFALRPPQDPLWDLVDGIGRRPQHRVVDATTFGKWGPDLAAATVGAPALVLAGVSTDCCVLSTALGAADAGVGVRVVADACAGVSETDHERALAAMALYDPLVRVVDAASVLSALGAR